MIALGLCAVLLLAGGSDPIARFDAGTELFAARRLADARAAFDAAIQEFEADGRDVDAALAREALARVQIEQADWLGASETLDAAVEALDTLPPLHPHRARHVALRAIVAQALGAFDEAEAAHEEALTDYRALHGNQHANVAAMLQNLATLTAARGDSLTTSILLKQALDIVDRNHGRDDPRRVRSLSTWARWRLESGDLDGAREGFAEADRVVVVSRGTDHPDRIETLRGRARVAAAADSVERAIAWLETAGAIYQEAWAQGGRDLMRATAFRSPFGELAGMYARTGDFERAFEAWEAHVGRLAEGGSTAVASADDVRSVLAPGEVFVGWVEDATSMRRWAFVVDVAGVRWTELTNEGVRDAEASLRAVLADLDDGDPGDDLARAVYARWFDGVLDGAGHVVFVPSGALLGVPVAALVDESGRRLFERCTSARVPSASVFVALRRTERSVTPVRSLLAVADPVYGGGAALEGVEGEIILRSAAAGHAGALSTLPPLDGTRVEVEALLPFFERATVLMDSDATEARLQEALRSSAGFDVVHLATHALVDPLDPGRSAMVLTGAGVEDFEGPGDGLVALREVLDTWSLDAELVTLSACETGLGRATSTEGMLGFPYALMAVGARAVLVSDWKVEDRATALWMGAFYRAWVVDGVSKVEAVRRAQEGVRTWANAAGRMPYSDPAYWAGFGVVGE